MNWLSALCRGRLGLLLPLVVVASQLALIGHELQPEHSANVDCEFCLALERTDDALHDAELIQPALTAAVSSISEQSPLLPSRNYLTPLSRGPPTS